MKFHHKKSLGQNFLIDQNIIKKIHSSFCPNKNDLIIEIGPGEGALTKHLVKKECDVICFEIDTRLKEKLEIFESNNCKIIYEDFLKIELKKFINEKYEKIFFIGNLPYYITTAIINKITKESKPYEIIIMVQKEVAERFMAKPNSKQYNSLSVYLQYNYEIEKICDVNKKCFIPVPKVDSTVLKLKAKNKPIVKNEELLYKLIKDAFRQKRKNLKNNLKEYDLDQIEAILNRVNRSLKNRAEELELSDFILLSNNL